MGISKPPRPRYVALIGDLVGSRRLATEDRNRTQIELAELLGELDAVAGGDLASRFVITVGDEFQGLLTRAGPLPTLLNRIATAGLPARIRLGIGRGRLDTPRLPTAIGMDGPCFHRARAALEESERQRSDRTVFRGFGAALDRVLFGLAAGTDEIRDRWTPRQSAVAGALRRLRNQNAVATELGVTPQAVSKHAAAAGWTALLALEDALAAALELVDGADTRDGET